MVPNRTPTRGRPLSSAPRSPVRRFGQWAIILAAVAGVYAYAESGQRSPLLGKPAPELNLWVVAGGEQGQPPKRLGLSDLRDRVTVLEFWASWCGACQRTTPMLNELSAEFANDGVSFFAVNVEPSTESAVVAAHESIGAAFPTLHDRSGQVHQAYAVRALPTVVVIGRDGLISYSSSGMPSQSRLRKEISAAID